jgi:hypothetical protein
VDERVGGGEPAVAERAGALLAAADPEVLVERQAQAGRGTALDRELERSPYDVDFHLPLHAMRYRRRVNVP